ncbi:hypothetical protein M9H77_36431 [Catharanthus roseus]|uniref:Uncharacterized protein n=1 Tax=Catharanthus roseus TaxID=4058 RepID=A0ACB9ZUE1_CATRO|nr:hypothetical protein M9H77_36431 [Catharanthus roseus]
MSRHATSATSWGRIWISTLLLVPSTWIGDLTMNLSETLVGNGCTQIWASPQCWLKYLTSFLNINSTRAFKAHPNRPLLNCTYCLYFVNESHAELNISNRIVPIVQS